jgi:cell wall-associated NlpC family hydrolase
MRRRLPNRILVLLAVLSLGTACATSHPVTTASVAPRLAETSTRAHRGVDRSTVVKVAEAQLGVPYRYGGGSPSGFDCSGLVVYSYAQAGLPGLPHSARALEDLSTQTALHELEPGDLLFFHLGARKANHVAIYVGDRQFVHAPSKGKRVERVSFDHDYWSTKLGLAGRLVH